MKVNSIIQASDGGKYEVTETLQQIQEQSQKGKLLFLHAKVVDSKEFHSVLVNVDEIDLAMSAEDVKKEKDSMMRKKIENEEGVEGFIKGFAAHLYDKYHD